MKLSKTFENYQKFSNTFFWVGTSGGCQPNIEDNFLSDIWIFEPKNFSYKNCSWLAGTKELEYYHGLLIEEQN